MSLRWHLLLGKPLWETGLIFFLSMGWLCTKCMYTICPFCEIWAVCVFWITYGNLSAVDQSLLGKNQQGAFRRIWKTLFCTVLINQGTLVCMIPWCCKSIHYPDKFLQRVIFFPKNLAWDASLLSKKYGGLLINQWNLRKSEAGSEATS